MGIEGEKNKAKSDDAAWNTPNKLSGKRSNSRSHKKDDKFLRRMNVWINAILAYFIVGFLVTIGWLYATSTYSPAWLIAVLSLLGVALRIALIAGILALVFTWFRAIRRRSDKAKAADRLRMRKNFQQKPLQSILLLISALLLLGAGPIGILYYFVIPTNFTPSAELRNFSHIIMSIAAVVGVMLGIMLSYNERKNFFAAGMKFGERLMILAMPFICPAILAICWLLFAYGPLANTLHLFAEKEMKVFFERNVKGGTAGSADFMCGGFWTAELHDHSFWWPRRVCNIDLDTQNALQDGGDIMLRAEVSRYGMNVMEYRVSK